MYTAIHGANAYVMPVALVSRAVAAPIFLISSGSLQDDIIIREDDRHWQRTLICRF